MKRFFKHVFTRPPSKSSTGYIAPNYGYRYQGYSLAQSPYTGSGADARAYTEVTVTFTTESELFAYNSITATFCTESELLAYSAQNATFGTESAILAYGSTTAVFGTESALSVYAPAYATFGTESALNAYEAGQVVFVTQSDINAYNTTQCVFSTESALTVYKVWQADFVTQSELKAFEPTQVTFVTESAITAYLTKQAIFSTENGLSIYNTTTATFGTESAINVYLSTTLDFTTESALLAYTATYATFTTELALLATELFYGYAINIETGTLTKYESFNFNSLSPRFGAKDDGIYSLSGSDDNGTVINWLVKTGNMDFKSPKQKRITDIYSNMNSSGATVLTVTTDSGTTAYSGKVTTGTENRKFNLARGHKGRFWSVQLANKAATSAEGNINELELIVEDTSRRV